MKSQKCTQSFNLNFRVQVLFLPETASHRTLSVNVDSRYLVNCNFAECLAVIIFLIWYDSET